MYFRHVLMVSFLSSESIDLFNPSGPNNRLIVGEVDTIDVGFGVLLLNLDIQKSTRNTWDVAGVRRVCSKGFKGWKYNLSGMQFEFKSCSVRERALMMLLCKNLILVRIHSRFQEEGSHCGRKHLTSNLCSPGQGTCRPKAFISDQSSNM